MVDDSIVGSYQSLKASLSVLLKRQEDALKETRARLQAVEALLASLSQPSKG